MIYTSFFSYKSYWTQLCYLLLFVSCGFTIFSSLALLVGKLYFGTDVDSRGYFYIIQSVSTFGTFLAPALLFSYCATKKWFSYNKADQVAPPPLVGYVILLSLFILPVIACLGYFNEQISLPESFQKIELWMREMEEKNLVLVQTLTANSNIPILLLNIMLVAFLPAFFEEFLFRGTIQPFLSKWFLNKKIAILVTAFIFSTIHFQFYGFIPRFLLGIYLGYLFVWSKSLWLPVIAHFMHNANSLIFDYAIQKRGIDMETIEPSKISGFYPTAIICTLLVAFGIFLLYKKSRQILL